MPIQDSNAARRNLVVTSAVFIIYYWAGGKIKGDDIKLPMINMVFENGYVLAVLAWVALFWFCFRYWQETRAEFKKQFTTDVHYAARASKSISRFISRQLKDEYSPHIKRYISCDHQKPTADMVENSLTLCFRIYPDNNLFPYFQFRSTEHHAKKSLEIDSFKPSATKEALSWTETSNGKRQVHKIHFYNPTYYAVLFHIFLFKNSINTYLPPYILFLLALMSGIFNFIAQKPSI